MSDLQSLSGSYTIDPAHTQISFVTRHAMVTKVRGSFTEFTGQAQTQPGLQNAEIRVEIDAASVDTRNKDRDAHLVSAEFFDAEQHPKLTFVSTEVTSPDAETLRVTGDLTIKGVSNPVTIDFEYNGGVTDPFGAERVGLEGSVQINRKDWDLTWNAALETGGVLVSEKVTLEFEVAAVKNS